VRTALAVVIVGSSLGALSRGLAAEPLKPNDRTLGQAPPDGAVRLFNGHDLAGWIKTVGRTPAAWTVADGLLTVKPGAGSIMTEKTFGDFQLHLEFNVPYMPDAKGQARGNSGIYLDGIYELQILDSYGLTLGKNDCGAIYNLVIPSVNVCKPPLQWQTYDVTFHKAERKDGKIAKKARVTVIHNGVKTIDDAEITINSKHNAGNHEGEDGPILLQDHGNEVQFRNIWIKPL
jgi:hypothetical protein